MSTPQCWQDFADAMEAGVDRIILFGPPGTGKTYAGLNIGCTASERIICTEDMTDSDIVGCSRPVGDEWKWIEGKAIRAWDNGHRVVADEIDRASGDVFSTLLAMFDSPESAAWKHPITGHVHRPQHGFSVVMTTNVEDMRELPDALRDRFPVAIRIDRPHPDALLRLAPDLRGAADRSADADENRRFSIRAFMEFDRLRQSMDHVRAARLIFGEQSMSILDALAVEGVS